MSGGHPLQSAVLVFFAGALCGCVFEPLATYQPTLENTQLARQLATPGLAVGEFKLANGLQPTVDRTVSVRGSSTNAPGNGSFSTYLKESLITELKSGGKYTPDANTVVTGELVESELNGGLADKGNAVLAARFLVTRSGSIVYDKVVRATHEWETSFMGAVAIPRAFNEYNGMYPRLVSKLLADEQFRAAVADK